MRDVRRLGLASIEPMWRRRRRGSDGSCVRRVGRARVELGIVGRELPLRLHLARCELFVRDGGAPRKLRRPLERNALLVFVREVPLRCRDRPTAFDEGPTRFSQGPSRSRPTVPGPLAPPPDRRRRWRPLPHFPASPSASSSSDPPSSAPLRCLYYDEAFPRRRHVFGGQDAEDVCGRRAGVPADRRSHGPGVGPAVAFGGLGCPRGQRLSGRAQCHLPRRQQLRSEDGHLPAPRGHDAAEDARVLARGLLGRRAPRKVR